MKRLGLFIMIIAPLWLMGCAGTTVRDRQTGRTKFHTQADVGDLAYEDGDTKLWMKDVKHSTATKAGGDAFAKGVQSVGGAGATLGLPGFLGGAIK